MKTATVKGISLCNPVDLDRDYLLFTAEYAVKNGYNHYQFIGPIHNPLRGNIDGMVFYRKYSAFNYEKDAEYVNYCIKTVNEVCDKLKSANVKTYMWHHELELPEKFGESYPDTLNRYGDIEISHPLVKDFLENKIADFFGLYPKMDGIILTLHETRIPLLKLKNQKLGKIERVKHVTEILYNACRERGKELIVRPFASMPEDYEMMTKAYEEISSSLVIMDKWTQFDWSLCLPQNAFFNKIKHNPLLVETDIFGEYFGKGALPLMLKDHITRNYAYCESFSPIGYVSRVDRADRHAFGDVNEVNYIITEACMNGKSGKELDAEVLSFFETRYGESGKDVYALMEKTEEVQKKMFYLNGYYYSEMSAFPSLNHCKNHFYFEIMKDDCRIASKEWYMPIGWKRDSKDKFVKEKEEAVKIAEKLLEDLDSLNGKLSPADFDALKIKFGNLYYCALLWRALTDVIKKYSEYFDKKSSAAEKAFYSSVDELKAVYTRGQSELKENFYTAILPKFGKGDLKEPVTAFISEITESFAAEKAATEKLEKQNLTDYIVCGGGNESHELQKEVNFSDTYVSGDGICRIPGTNRGKSFSTVNAHGWFSYLIKVKKNSQNKITVSAKGENGNIDFCLDLDGTAHEIHEKSAALTDIEIDYNETEGKEYIRLRIDRISADTPFVYTIKVK